LWRHEHTSEQVNDDVPVALAPDTEVGFHGRSVSAPDPQCPAMLQPVPTEPNQ